MRFRSKETPRGIIRSRDQRRLTLTIIGTGVLVVVVMLAGRPGFLASLTGITEPNSGDTESRSTTGDLTRLQGDEFLSGPEATAEEAAPLDLKALLDREEAARLERLSQAGSTIVSEAGPEPVPEDLMRPVRDDIIGVHSNEADAYFASLRLAQKIDSAEAPDGRYALFMDSPESCRGRAWKLTGKLRRLNRMQSDANSFGVRTLYDAWISLPDSGNQLVHVVASSADSGLQLGDTSLATAPEVTVTGYFFKREGYVRAGDDGQGDAALTPLLLAGRLRKFVAAAPPTNVADELTPWLGWLTLLICGGVAVVFWQFQISDNLFRRTRTHQLTTLPVRVSFDGVSSVTVSEALRQMEQNSEQPHELVSTDS